MTIMDHYPPDIMSKCEGQGIFGRCGEDCPLFIDGDCHIEDEIQEQIIQQQTVLILGGYDGT